MAIEDKVSNLHARLQDFRERLLSLEDQHEDHLKSLLHSHENIDSLEEKDSKHHMWFVLGFVWLLVITVLVPLGVYGVYTVVTIRPNLLFRQSSSSRARRAVGTNLEEDNKQHPQVHNEGEIVNNDSNQHPHAYTADDIVNGDNNQHPHAHNKDMGQKVQLPHEKDTDV